MERPYNGIFDDKEYCMKEILLARKVFGDVKTTRKKYQKMCDGLALLYLYCPKEIKPLAEATIKEASIRYIYFEKIWKIRELNNV